MSQPNTPAGIDEAPVSAWLAAHVAEAEPPFTYELITGGRSNLTYEVRDAADRGYVLRRPPMGHLLPTAHDVLREHRLIASLGGTGVPVPQALAACDDPSINGAPFFVTRFVEGVVLDSTDKASALTVETREALAHDLVAVLGKLHAVDLEAVGIADLSRREGYLERQIRRWTKQWAGSRTRDLPLIDEIATRLHAAMPEQHDTTIVHGDYRFGNCISDTKAGSIAAVLDWELCTLGDPLADLGHLAVYWSDPRLSLGLTNDPTAAGGFPSYEDLLERYARATGRNVSGIGYYRAFAAWRLGVIAEGVASRHLARHPEDAAALDGSQKAVEHLARFAMESLSAAGA